MDSKAFKLLQQHYYKLLKATGFEDIEDTTTPQRFLKTWHSSYFQSRHTATQAKEIEDYYRRADEVLREYSFSTRIEREVWRLHAEGFAVRAIAVQLDIKPGTVHKIIVTIRSLNYARL